MNGYFKLNDEYANDVCGYPIEQAWWSRHYEYPWAYQFVHDHAVVADMGAGWMGRPFKDALCEWCDMVYAVDLDERIQEQPREENLRFVTADFTKRIDDIPAHSLDTIFCISVLEDLGGNIGKALAEFKRLMKPNGLIVITMDMQYDMTKPLGEYPAGNVNELITAMQKNGLQFCGDVDMDKTDAVYHSGYNLCVFHAVQGVS